MKICIISQYPPIEGGISSKIYWLAKGLGELGNEIFVVSDCWEAEKNNRELIAENEFNKLEPKNVNVYSTSSQVRFHMNYSQDITTKLVSLATNIIRKYDIDLIYSYYLPYCIPAFFVKQIVKKPLVIKHAAVDIEELYTYPFFNYLLNELFFSSDKIITFDNKKNIFLNLKISSDKLISWDLDIDTKIFNPEVKPFDLSKYTYKDIKVPVITFFGRITKNKKLYEFLEATAKLKDEDFLILLVVGSDKSVDDTKKFVETIGLRNKTIFLPFQPPWTIPSIMTASTCIICPSKGNLYSIVPREAIACGRCTIISDDLQKQKFYNELEDGVNVISINPSNIDQFRNKLKMIISNPDMILNIGKEARKFSEKNEKFEHKISEITDLFKSLINTP